jgi:hypothetical protein
MEKKIDILRSLRIIFYEIFVAWRPFLLCVACQHALQADTNTLYIVDRTPALTVKQVKTDDAIRVDVWVPRYRVRVVFDENHFGSFCFKRWLVRHVLKIR